MKKATMRMIMVGIVVAAMLCLAQGCARKNVSQTQGAGMAGQAGMDMTQDGQGQGMAGDKETMTPEEMSEYALQEKERQEQMASEAAQAEKKRSQAVQNLQDRIHFAFDSYELRLEARQTLKAKAEILDRYPKLEVIIEGHCDERGTDEYNLALGERRARAAYEFLVLLGIDPDRLSIISYGEERPLDPGHNETAWQKNRRCEFRLAQ